ncbi:hypothetical protein [Streptomyces sp. NPDC059708]|uniref:hypothetical protein n=1 Tax=Streptomyces sp. NPDC059708 TaxID=3346916 RepID=UPI0036B10C42
MKRIARASAALLLTGAAAAGVLAASAGTAAAAGYANTLVRNINYGDSGANWNECNRHKNELNNILMRSGNRDPQVYYYCAPAEFGNGVQWVNLWFRHQA